MRNRVFVDSNIWLYLFLQDDDEKYKNAEQYFVNNNLNTIFITSYQVINEVSNVLLKKKFTEAETRKSIDCLLKVCALQKFAKEILLTASHVRVKIFVFILG